MIGELVTGDFGSNTMTFEIEDKFILKAGRYRITLIDDVLESEACQEFKVSSPDLLRLRTRIREVVLTRQVVMYYDLVFNKVSQTVAAERFGLDHATANHAKKTITNLLETDKGFKEQFNSIIDRLNRI